MSKTAPIDKRDREILRILQKEGCLSNQELAERIHMAPSPCWRRVKQMESSGLIRGYRAVLDREQLGLGLMALVRISIDSHSETEARRFEHELAAMDEVHACFAVTGEADFVLQVVAADLDAYARFAMQRLRRLPGIKSMNTMFVLREIKETPVLPVD